MNALKGYLLPAASKKSQKADKPALDVIPPPPVHIQMTDSPSTGSSIIKSSRSSLYPQGDFRNAHETSLLEIKSAVMVNYLYQTQMERLWSQNGAQGEGTVLKMAKDSFVCAPAELKTSTFFQQVKMLNVKVRAPLTSKVFCTDTYS